MSFGNAHSLETTTTFKIKNDYIIRDVASRWAAFWKEIRVYLESEGRKGYAKGENDGAEEGRKG